MKTLSAPWLIRLNWDELVTILVCLSLDIVEYILPVLMVPLAGDVSAEQIAALLLDVSAMSLRLAKPLTARLMPIPGKQAGDKSEFDFAFFANSKVMRLESAGLGYPFSGDEVIQIKAR